MSETPNVLTVAETTPQEERPAGTGRTGIMRLLPTGFVLAVLAAIALGGHYTGWKMPSFATLIGARSPEKSDWCEEHSVAESECVECKPELLPRGKDYGWCALHGVPNCPWEHPDVAQIKEATRVNPADLARAKRSLEFARRPENSSKCKRHLRRVQFASQEAFEKSGVDVERVWYGPVMEYIAANGEVTYDQTHVARVSARVPGSAWKVVKQVGDTVRQDEVLALVDAAEVGKAKAEFLHAIAAFDLRSKTYERMQAAAASVPEQTLRQAETALREAEIRVNSAEQALANLGLPVQAAAMKGLRPEEIAGRVRFLSIPVEQTRGLDSRSSTANLLPLVAPLDGVVVAREVVAGEVVDTSKALFVIADVRRMWITLNLRLEDARRVSVGTPVRFRPDGAETDEPGKVAWISTAVDPKTRTLKVRADLDNASGRLIAHAFGAGRIMLREEPDAIVVPNEAVHWEGDCNVVFVRDKNFLTPDAPKVFHTRTVRIGAHNDQHTEIIAGLLPGEVVATKGSGVLRTEILKGNLGEG